MTAAALCKVALLLASCGLLQATITAPQPPPTTKDKVYKRGWFEHGVTFIVVTCALGYALATVCPAVVILATLADNDSEYASSAYRSLCPRPASSPAIASLTPGFMLGAALLTIGTIARLWCFRTLGRFFTFQVTVKQDHQLITTGPYAVVRHPSYSTITVACIGLIAMSFAKGGYFTECGLMATPARWPILGWIAFISMVLYGATKRVNVEDRLLREAFGEEWLQYSQRVRYRLLPGVY